SDCPYLPGSLRSRPLPPSGHSPAPLPLHGGEILKVTSGRSVTPTTHRPARRRWATTRPPPCCAQRSRRERDTVVDLRESPGGTGQWRSGVRPPARQVFLVGATAPYLPGSLRSRPLPPAGHSPAPLPLHGGEILKVKAAPGSIRCRPPVPPRRRASPRRRVPAPPG